ncbi:MAG: clpS [Schumannella sp.]|nr:clpS [Schumannella sp.]
MVPDVAGSSPVIHPSETEQSNPLEALDTPWTTTVFNDPVNLMSYVTHVFRTYFGYPKPEAERLMLLVHHEGRAVVATGRREEMERHTEAMHEYGLWASVVRA